MNVSSSITESALVSKPPAASEYEVDAYGGLNSTIFDEMIRYRYHLISVENFAVKKILSLLMPVVQAVADVLDEKKSSELLTLLGQARYVQSSFPVLDSDEVAIPFTVEALREAKSTKGKKSPLSATGVSRLAQILGRELSSIVNPSLTRVYEVIHDIVADLYDSEPKIISSLIRKAFPSGIADKILGGVLLSDEPPTEKIKNLVLGGERYGKALEKRYGNTLARAENRMALGLLRGEGMKSISRDVKSMLKKDLAGGAARLVRTEIQRASAKSQAGLYGRNKDIIKAETWMGTLDTRICVLGGRSLVKTDNGWKQIRKIKVGDSVLTHNDRYRKVIHVSNRQYEGDIVHIGISGRGKPGRGLKVTADHKIYVKKSAGWKWMAARRLRRGNVVAVPGHMCAGECGKILPEWRTRCYSCHTVHRNAIYWTKSKRREMSVRMNAMLDDPIMGKKFRDQARENVRFMQTKESYAKSSAAKRLRWRTDEKFRAKMILVLKQNAQSPNNVLKNPITRTEMLKKAWKVRGSNHLGSGLERRVRWALNTVGLKYKPAHYMPVGEKRHWVDFYLPKHNAVIECDGDYTHGSKSSKIRDRKRQHLIQHLIEKEYGVKFLRFNESEIKSGLGNIVIPTLQRMRDGCVAEIEIKDVRKYRVHGHRVRNYRVSGSNRVVGQTVYDLTIDKDNSFYVNGIAVHNCLLCGGLDGKVFKVGEGPQPVEDTHPQCRCIRSPVVKSWRELGIDFDEAPPATRASMNGAVPGRTTFSDWFKKQPAAVKKDILGAGRYELYRLGRLGIGDFVINRRILTLKQLRKKYGIKD